MKIGEHLAVFWIEDGNSFVWYLCVVDDIKNDSSCSVSNLTRNNKSGTSWLFPDELKSNEILSDQMNINVTYHQTERIRCAIDNTLVSKISKDLEFTKDNYF